MECIGDFETIREALRYALELAVEHGWTVYTYGQINGRWSTYTHPTALAQWYMLGGTPVFKHSKSGRLLNWNELVGDEREEVKAEWVRVLTEGLALQAEAERKG